MMVPDLSGWPSSVTLPETGIYAPRPSGSPQPAPRPQTQTARTRVGASRDVMAWRIGNPVGGTAASRNNARSVRIRRDHLARSLGAEPPPGDQADRVLDKPDRAIQEQGVYPTGM